MFDEEEEDEENMLELSNDLLLQRSKSYDARLNYVCENSVYYINNNNNNNNEDLDDNKKLNNKQRDQNESTQIIVSSFAPDPKTKNLIRTTIQTRPISQQVILKSVETTEHPSPNFINNCNNVIKPTSEVIQE
jgi:hypothetical protein